MTGYRTSREFANYQSDFAGFRNSIPSTRQHLHRAAECSQAAARMWDDGLGASAVDEWLAKAEWHIEQAKRVLAVHMGD